MLVHKRDFRRVVNTFFNVVKHILREDLETAKAV